MEVMHLDVATWEERYSLANRDSFDTTEVAGTDSALRNINDALMRLYGGGNPLHLDYTGQQTDIDRAYTKLRQLCSVGAALKTEICTLDSDFVTAVGVPCDAMSRVKPEALYIANNVYESDSPDGRPSTISFKDILDGISEASRRQGSVEGGEWFRLQLYDDYLTWISKNGNANFSFEDFLANMANWQSGAVEIDYETVVDFSIPAANPLSIPAVWEAVNRGEPITQEQLDELNKWLRSQGIDAVFSQVPTDPSESGQARFTITLQQMAIYNSQASTALLTNEMAAGLGIPAWMVPILSSDIGAKVFADGNGFVLKTAGGEQIGLSSATVAPEGDQGGGGGGSQTGGGGSAPTPTYPDYPTIDPNDYPTFDPGDYPAYDPGDYPYTGEMGTIEDWMKGPSSWDSAVPPIGNLPGVDTGQGETMRGFDLTPATPEQTAHLDMLAGSSDSGIVKIDGQYCLKDTIEVTFDADAYFKEKGIDPDGTFQEGVTWRDEYNRQVELQQASMNDLSVAEWEHNVAEYNKPIEDGGGMIGQTQQGVAWIKAGGREGDGMAILSGLDQSAGGRPEVFNGLGDAGINASIQQQWAAHVEALQAEVQTIVDATGVPADSDLLRYVHMNVDLNTQSTAAVGHQVFMDTLSSQASDSGALHDVFSEFTSKPVATAGIKLVASEWRNVAQAEGRLI